MNSAPETLEKPSDFTQNNMSGAPLVPESSPQPQCKPLAQPQTQTQAKPRINEEEAEVCLALYGELRRCIRGKKF